MISWALLALIVDTSTYRGAAREITVAVPRIEESIVVDGSLNEAVWGRAARLTDFSQFSPSDGRPALQSTTVLIWYSPTAIHFGIKATAQPGTVRARLGDRDRGIIPDDYIELQLGTFNDGRQVFVFAANPLGVQADGSLIEGNAVRRGGGADDRSAGREQADLNPDYAWDSKGQVTDSGFQIEIRIPFKSLRYQRASIQDWTLQVIRKTAATGLEDTWAPARRAASSFVSQAGRLTGLHDLRRGLVLELNPVATSTVTGAPGPARWDYAGGRPEFGGNLKWGVSNDLALNAAINPDFSQVESDAGQITPDPRTTVFFQEKRPFFLDGIEYFATPTQVIYTRRIAAPVAAARFAGRVGRFNVGILSAVDGREAGLTGRHPVHNILRIQRDLGRQSRVGIAYTDRVEGANYNRVVEGDSRFLFGGVYSLAVNGALSRTRTAGMNTTAPSWSVTFARTGRHFGWQSSFRGIDPAFDAQSGFVSRGNLAQLNFRPSVTVYGSPGALVERFVGSLNLDALWQYHDLFNGRHSLERKFSPGTSWVLRGGWGIGLSLLIENFSADPGLYADYAIERSRQGGGTDTVAYLAQPLPDLPNFDVSLNVATPQIHGMELTGFLIYGKDENFLEWTNAMIWLGRLGLAFRPNDKLRFDGSLAFRTYHRSSDGSLVNSTWIPRLKTEYQVSRTVFVRLVGEYNANRQDDLRDDGRSGAPILIRDVDGIYKRSLAAAGRTNTLRVDWLFSYQPTPGTVFFAGYGSSLSEDRAFAFRRLHRTTDGFFTKFSYNFRM